MKQQEAEGADNSKSYNFTNYRPWETKRANLTVHEKPSDEFLAEVEHELQLAQPKPKRSARKEWKEDSDRIAWYGRNSSKAGIDSTSDFRQNTNAVRICLQNNLGDPSTMVGFFDYGLSGANLNRPELDRLITFLRENRGCSLIVEDIDRLIRDEPVLLVLGSVIVECGVKVYDADGRVLESDLIKKGQIASDIRRMYRTRSMQTRHEILAEGAICFKPPLGYQKIPSDLVKDAKVGHLIQKMYDMKLAGDTVSDLLRWLHNENKVRPPKGKILDWATVRDVLRNPIYIGSLKMEFEGRKYEFQREDLRLVDTRTWLAVQDQMRAEANDRKKAKTLDRPRVAPSARLLVHACLCRECQTSMRQDLSGRPREKMVLKCKAAMTKACGMLENFLYTDVEQAVLSDIAALLAEPSLDEIFRQEDLKCRHETIALDEGRLSELEARIEEKQRKIEQTWESASEVTPKLMDFMDRQNEQVSIMEADRDKLRANLLRPVEDTELPTLAKEIANLTAAGPFTPVTGVERQIFAMIKKLVSRIYLRRIDTTKAEARVTLDFSRDLGREPGSVVIERTVRFGTEPTSLEWDDTLLIGQTVKSGRHRLSDAEFAILAACPVVAETLGVLTGKQMRTCLDALALSASLNIPHGPILMEMRMANTRKTRGAISDLRHHEHRVHFVDIFHGLRPGASGINRLVAWGRPTRSARWELEKLDSLILLHPLCTREGKDRLMTDSEWKPVFAAIAAHATRKLYRDSLRRNLDDLFCVLRKGTTISSRVPINRRTGFYAWFKIIRETGELEVIAAALLRHAGIPVPD